MTWLQSISSWLTGNGNYMKLSHCMGHDWFWITLTVSLDLTVAAGYAIIAYHWWRNERLLHACAARSALGTMRNIFIFCCICGYIFIPVKMFWPAWRLYDLFLAGLVYYTWRYVWNVKDLKVIYTAIGDSSHLAEELAQSREESKQKSFFLNAVSHDLRTPLNGLLLYADLAEMQTGSDPAATRESISEIKACARMTADLLDRLLEYARMDGTEGPVVIEEFSLGELFRDLAIVHREPSAHKGLTLSTNVKASLRLRTDKLKLERILNNLLSNAIKYTAVGSVRLEADWAGSNVEIHVIDTGVGIAPENCRRLFEEFFQVHNHERDRQKGYGLGLAISKRLAKQLAGDLTVDSVAGKGSRFTLFLPSVLSPTGIETRPRELAVQSIALGQQSTSAAG